MYEWPRRKPENWGSLRGKVRSAGRADHKPRESKSKANGTSGFRSGRKPGVGAFRRVRFC